MKKCFKFFALFFLASIFFGYYADAEETHITDEFPVIIRGTRPVGMGNAFIAMQGSDSNAQFYNPASINDFDSEISYEVSAPAAEFDAGIFPMISDLLKLRDDLHNATGTQQKIDIFKEFAEKDTGRYNHLSSSMVLFQARNKNFSASMIADNHSVISLRDQAFPNFELKTTTTFGPVVGGAIGLLNDDLQLGTNIKFLYRMGIEKQIIIGDILVNSISDLIGFGAWDKGFGVGMDLGLKYKLPFAKESLNPTIGATIQDLGNTYFTDDAPPIPMSVSLGAGIFPKIGNVGFSILADFRELNRQKNFLTKFHFGIEAKFPKTLKTIFSLRAGCNQGYPAVGASASWGLVTMNLAFYGEEAGEYDYSKADYRGAVGFDFIF